MLTLEQIIDNSRDSREIKRALAVKMALKGIKHSDIADFLQVSDSFITKWNSIYEQQGAEALQLGYKVRSGLFVISLTRGNYLVFKKQASL